MSNDSSASETTPLQRPGSQKNNEPDVSLSSSFTVVTMLDAATTTTPFTTVAIDGWNNNNHVQVRSTGGAEVFQGDGKFDETASGMDTNKRILSRVAIDLLILTCVALPILCFVLWGKTYKRGFFCDDESLKHPYKDSTVRYWMLYIIGMIPIGVFVTVEILISKQSQRKSNGNSSARRYIFLDHEIPNWIIECYKKFGIFAFGLAVCMLTVEITKHLIGRLRPHFFDVCKPIIADGTTCDDPINAGKYIEDFRCEGGNSTEKRLREARLSFPSGHSSFTFYTMVYLAIYLQSRMTWRGSKLMRHFFQFLLILIAWFTALSRVSDYKHHWSDVLAGSVMGALTAVIVANYVSDLFKGESA